MINKIVIAKQSDVIYSLHTLFAIPGVSMPKKKFRAVMLVSSVEKFWHV